MSKCSYPECGKLGNHTLKIPLVNDALTIVCCEEHFKMAMRTPPTPVEIEFTTKGEARAVYKDELRDVMEELGPVRVARASLVEWEDVDGRSGWTVRAAHDPELALRVVDWCRWEPRREGSLVTFQTREEALREELKFFWQLLPQH